MTSAPLADPVDTDSPPPEADPAASAERDQARLHYAGLAGWLAAFGRRSPPEPKADPLQAPGE